MLRDGIENEIIAWMQRKVEERGADGAVVGLSGGIDSSTTAVLTKKAFGDNCLGVMLPASGTVGKDMKYSKVIAEKFDIDTITLNLEDVNNQLEETFHSADIEKVDRNYYPQTCINTPDCAEQNIQTRMRMMALYYIAECKNYVVMGTNNKSEIISGYFTLYGDGGTDMRPLGDLTKTEVWELAGKIGVPEDIIDRPPTGGLQGGEEGATDEEEFGIDYRTFDKIYEALDNGGDLSQFDIEKVNRVNEILAKAKNKAKVPTFKK